jgi:hypothetical protein
VDALTSALLPRYFSHSRYHSFTRQLNMYGFMRVFGAPPRDGDRTFVSLPRAQPQRRFAHPHFTRDRPGDVRVSFSLSCCAAPRVAVA